MDLFLCKGKLFKWTFGDELRYSDVSEIHIIVTDVYGSYRVQTVKLVYCGCEHLSQCGKNKSFVPNI